MSRGTHALHSMVLYFSPHSLELKTNMKICSSATCEVWSVIQFLNARNLCPVEIQREIVEVYGKGAVIEGNVRI